MERSGMNIIRLKMPEPKRFKAFTVSEYRDLLVIRNEIQSNAADEKQIFEEMLEELYPDYTMMEREYIFINVLLASIGKDKIEAVFNCPKCKRKSNMLLNLRQQPLGTPTLKVSNITIKFKYPDKRYDLAELFFKCVDTVNDGENTYEWSKLTKADKDAVVDLISYETFKELASQLLMIDTYQTVTCCTKHEIKYNDALSLFKVILNPTEIFQFYRINHVLAKHDYSIGDLMNMMPFERSLVLTLVEKDVKNKQNQNKG